MLYIYRDVLESLAFNLDEAVKAFQESRKAHALTIDVPAPVAHPLVEAIVAEGGYQVMEVPQPEPAPETEEPVENPTSSDSPSTREELFNEFALLVKRGQEIAQALGASSSPADH